MSTSIPLCCSPLLCNTSTPQHSYIAAAWSRARNGSVCYVPNRFEVAIMPFIPLCVRITVVFDPHMQAAGELDSGRPPGRQLLGLNNGQSGWQDIREALGRFTEETYQNHAEINTYPQNVLIFTHGVFFHQKTCWKCSSLFFFFFFLQLGFLAELK